MTASSVTPGGSLNSPPASRVVFLVDSHSSLRSTLEALVDVAGWQTERAASLDAFLEQPRALAPSCLVLDVSHPDFGALLMSRWPASVSVICIAEPGDVSLTVQAMKAGAVDVLTNPIDVSSLLEAIQEALHRSGEILRQQCELSGIRECYSALSRREREVMSLVVSGLMNKQVAGELGISEITVKAHRGRLMRKMKARSLAGLVMLAARLQPLEECNSH